MTDRHILFGHKDSGSAAVECALTLAGVPYEVVLAASWDAGSALDRLAAANPLRQIPTLVLPDGTVLTESAAILIHLGLTHPDSGLLPTDPSARALQLRGLVYIPANCYADIGITDHPERWLRDPTDEAKRNLVNGARARLRRNWKLFADTFPATPYLGGAEPGALDLLAVVVSRWSGGRRHLEKARPDFCRVLASIERHPRLRPVLSRHWDID